MATNSSAVDQPNETPIGRGETIRKRYGASACAFIRTMDRRKCEETVAWTSVLTNTYTHTQTEEVWSRQRTECLTDTLLMCFDGLAVITMETDAHLREQWAYANQCFLCRYWTEVTALCMVSFIHHLYISL